MYFFCRSVLELHSWGPEGRKSRMLRNALLILSLILTSATATQAKVTSCQPLKTGLAIDQRDDFRFNCLKQNRSNLTVARCLKIANTMEYSINAEEAKLTCMFELQKQITLKECLETAKSLEYPDSGDQARWECLQRFSKVMPKNECQQLSEGMSYPANKHRALAFCHYELDK